MDREDPERREVFGAGSREDLIRAYAGWAERYDEDMRGRTRCAPSASSNYPSPPHSPRPPQGA